MPGEYDRALDRRLAGFQGIIDRNREDKLLRGKTREEKERFAREQAAQASRDARLNLYDVQGVNQRAGIAADAAYNEQGYTLQRDKQQTMDQLKRDAAQQGYTLQRDDRQQRNQLQRDAIQQGYGVQDDERQFGYQAQRDSRLQEYDVLNDERQFGQQSQRDERQQGYTQQNATQRETFDVAAKWQEQVQQARNAGYQFSEQQNKEMQTLEEAMRKNVLNGDFYEGDKQHAMLLYHRKLAGFVPNEKTVDEDAEANGSMRQHKETGIWLMKRRGSQGHMEWEPITTGGGQKQEDPAKEAQRLQKLDLERTKALEKITADVKAETTPGNLDQPLFKGQDAIDKEVMLRFADYERVYTSDKKLPPHQIFQHAAEKKRRLEEMQFQQRQQAWQGVPARELPSQYDGYKPRALREPQQQRQPDAQPLVQPTAQAAEPPAKRKPVAASSASVADQIKIAQDSGDQESADALQFMQSVVEKFKGIPQEGTPEHDRFMEAFLFLESKGIAFQPGKMKQKAKPVLEYNFPN